MALGQRDHRGQDLPLNAPTVAERLAGELARARRDPALAVLEGVHAVKHAHRFGADFVVVVVDLAAAEPVASAVAPDLLPFLVARATALPAAQFRRLVPRPPDTGVIAVARRPGGGLLALRRDRRSSC